jgi:choline dehydrogenase-like flavoprotein
MPGLHPKSAAGVVAAQSFSAILGGLADVLLPASGRMPAASKSGIADIWIKRVLSARPDLIEPLNAIVGWAELLNPAEAVRTLHSQRPDEFAVLAKVISAAYYMNPKIRRLIGYPGQSQNPILVDEAEYDLRDGLLDPVLSRHGRSAIWPSASPSGPPERPAVSVSRERQSSGRVSSPTTADVVIIGAGASGAIAARHLAAAGFGVVCLEQGDWLSASGYPGDKREWELLAEGRWSPNPNVRQLREDYPCDVSEADVSPVMHNAVGGSTIHYGAQWARMRPQDFRVRSTDGIADDWPISYEELAPFYERMDLEMGVSGLGGDPMYPLGAAPPLPPIPIGPFGRKAAQGMNELGWNWWPASHAIPSRPYGNLGACMRRGTCTTGCPEGAKGSTDLTHWPAAIRDGARLITRARAREIVVDERGRASGVVYVDRDDKEQLQRASSVILAANGIGTPRLLLLSASSRFPEGLANSSGLVGKRLMLHPYVSVLGVYEDDLRSWQGPAGTPILSLEFGDTDESRGFARGAQWDTLTSRGPLKLLECFNDRPFEQRWGDAAHNLADFAFGHSFHWGIGIEDLPAESNTVTLHPTLTDSNSIPAPKVTYRIDAEARANLAFQSARAREAHQAAGALETVDLDWSAWGWHLLGTARMGDDPATSVVDRYGRSHDVPNLFVLDGSAFVTSGPMAPTATIAANALRCTEHLIRTAGTSQIPD